MKITFKKSQLKHFVVLFAIVITSVFFFFQVKNTNAFTPSDFLEIVENTDNCFNCYTIYKVKNPTNFDYLIDQNSKKFLIQFIGKSSDRKIEIQKIRQLNLTNSNYTQECSLYNETTSNSTQITLNNCIHVQYPFQYTINETYWQEFSPMGKIFPAHSEYLIKISGNIKWREKEDNILYFNGYNYTEYAWWNNSFGRRIALNITSNYSMNWTPIRENNLPGFWLTTNATSNCTKELIFTDNSTGTEIEVPSSVIIDNASINNLCLVSFQLNMTANVSKIIYAYMNASGTSSQNYDAGIKIRGTNLENISVDNEKYEFHMAYAGISNISTTLGFKTTNDANSAPDQRYRIGGEAITTATKGGRELYYNGSTVKAIRFSAGTSNPNASVIYWFYSHLGVYNLEFINWTTLGSKESGFIEISNDGIQNTNIFKTCNETILINETRSNWIAKNNQTGCMYATSMGFTGAYVNIWDNANSMPQDNNTYVRANITNTFYWTDKNKAGNPPNAEFNYSLAKRYWEGYTEINDSHTDARGLTDFRMALITDTNIIRGSFEISTPAANMPPPLINYPANGSTVSGNVNFSVNVTNGTNAIGSVLAEINGVNYTMTGGICYQEFSNTSTSCGGVAGGNYSFTSGVWTREPTNASDGNWVSFSWPGTTLDVGTVYFNYTIPINAVRSSTNWQVKDENATINLTIPSACWGTNLTLAAITYEEPDNDPAYTNWSCYDGSNWITVRNVNWIALGFTNTQYVYEEGMYWDISSYSYNRTITTTGNWTVYVNDSAGNWNNSDRYYFTVVSNNAPNVFNVSISPSVIYPTYTINASVNATDSDGDRLSINYTLYVCSGTSCAQNTTTIINGYINGTVNTTSFSNIRFGPGQKIYVNITTNDSNGGLVLNQTATIEVSNSTPLFFNSSISPANIYKNSIVNLSVNITNQGISTMTINISEFVNGAYNGSVIVGGYINNTINTTSFTRRYNASDKINFTIIANDSLGGFVTNESYFVTVLDNKLILNASFPIVNLSPALSYKNTIITCNASYSNSRSSTLILNTSFYVNNTLNYSIVDLSYANNSLKSVTLTTRFTPGHVVYCNMTANDSIDIVVNKSNSITILDTFLSLNSSFPTVNLSPAVPYTTSTIICNASYGNAKDATLLLNTSFYVNNVLNYSVLDAAYANNSLKSVSLTSRFTVGDIIYCNMTADDSIDVITNKSNSINITNRVPVVYLINITPTIAFRNSPITCNFNATDYENATYMNLTSRLYVNSVLNQTNINLTYNNETISSVVFSGYWGINNNITCNTTIHDGYGSVVNQSNTITISNRLPAIMLNQPANNSAMENLPNVTFSFNYTDADLDTGYCNLTYNGTILNESILLNGTVFNYTSVFPFNQYNRIWNVSCWDGYNRTTSGAYNVSLLRDIVAPTVDSLSPANYSVTYLGTLIDFIFLPADNINLANCSLLTNQTGNWAINKTITSIMNGSNNTISASFAEVRNITWGIGCYDNLSNVNFSINRTIFIKNNSPPSVTFSAFDPGTTGEQNSIKIIANDPDTEDSSFTCFGRSILNNGTELIPYQQINNTGGNEYHSPFINLDMDSGFVNTTTNCTDPKGATTTNISRREVLNSQLTVNSYNEENDFSINFTGWINLTSRDYGVMNVSVLLINKSNGVSLITDDILGPQRGTNKTGIWNSTKGFILLGANYTINYTIYVNASNLVTPVISSRNFEVKDIVVTNPSNITITPVEKTTQYNFNISIYTFTAANQTYNFTFELDNLSLFNASLGFNNTNIGYSNATNPIINSFHFNGNETTPDGIYYGNQTITRQTDGKKWIIPMAIYFNPPAGAITLLSTTNIECTQGILSACYSSGEDNDVYDSGAPAFYIKSFTYTIRSNNTGNFTISNCSIVPTMELGGSYSYTVSAANFSLNIGETRDTMVTFRNFAQGGINNIRITGTCDQATTLGYPAGTSGNNQPLVEASVTIYSAPSGSAGGGGGGGGGGQYFLQECSENIDCEGDFGVGYICFDNKCILNLTQAISEVTSVSCGNNICEPELGEDYFSCSDCTFDIDSLFSFGKGGIWRQTWFISLLVYFLIAVSVYAVYVRAVSPKKHRKKNE